MNKSKPIYPPNIESSYTASPLNSAQGASEIERFRQTVATIEREVGQVIVGQQKLVRQLLLTLLGGGNALLEGAPGLGKTMLIQTLAQVIDCSFSRIQFTPDLMPSDIVGTTMIAVDENSQRYFRFEAGPIFSNIVLADEINRATPKTQSALLEAMQERSVTVAKTSYALDPPFFVLATQNPIEMEGTYPLPEAQLDRFFFHINVEFPTHEELFEIANRTTGAVSHDPVNVTSGSDIITLQRLARQVPIATPLTRYAVKLLEATHPQHATAPDMVRRFVRYGASPRGLQAIIIAAKALALIDGRLNVDYPDLQDVLLPALRHRLILNFEGQAEGITADDILKSVIQTVRT
ncbi:AAA family ATPase [Anaerolineales bacterium HSG24]|nr:AAA family ATPase [Anaerolineales bacterium HSG24]